MMKRNKVVALLSLMTLGLVGCEEAQIQYDGKLLPISVVEEIMADKLEVENPGLDLEVNIYEETED